MTPDEKKTIKKAIKSLTSAASNDAAPSEKAIAREEILEDLIIEMVGSRDKEITSLRRAVKALKGEVQEGVYETDEMVELRKTYYTTKDNLWSEWVAREKEYELKEAQLIREFDDEFKRLKSQAKLRLAEDSLNQA